MSERELVHQSERCKTKDRSLAARLQSAASTQFAGLRAAGRVCTNTSGDAGMKKASTRLLEQETQTPSPAPDLIPAESSTENLHWDWYSKRGHFTTTRPFWEKSRIIASWVTKRRFKRGQGKEKMNFLLKSGAANADVLR